MMGSYQVCVKKGDFSELVLFTKLLFVLNRTTVKHVCKFVLIIRDFCLFFIKKCLDKYYFLFPTRHHLSSPINSTDGEEKHIICRITFLQYFFQQLETNNVLKSLIMYHIWIFLHSCI